MAKKAAKRRKKAAAKKSAAKKSAPKKKSAKKAAPKKAAKKSSAPVVAFGSITHTDFASSDPDATRQWAIKALGWKFKPSMSTPNGEYHMFAYSEFGGGGIGKVPPGESPASVPFLHVANCEKAFAKAVAAGAQPVMPPDTVMPNLKIAIVRAPGGVSVGFAGP